MTPPTHSAQSCAVDEIIDARWVVPVEPDGTVLENHSLVIDGDKILDLLPTPEAAVRFRAKRHRSLPEHVLMPGLINLHTHAAMALLRGYADDLHLMEWLQQHIWPAEHRHVSPAFVQDGTLLACWEMLRGGVTCFNDMYFFPAAAAEAALQAGMRASLGITVFDFPSAYGKDADDYLAKGLALREASCHQPLLSFCLAPHAPYTVSDKTFERVGMLADEHGLPIHIHLHETQDEISGSLKTHEVRPLARLDRLGLVNERLIAVHAVHLDVEELDLLAARQSHIAHCPVSNLKLASGIAPIPAMLERRINIGLGTDGAASNNRLDMFQEMRQAALLAKATAQDAAVLPAHQVLKMATLASAKALGIGDRVGSLKPGKQADLLALRLDDWIYQPCFDPVSHIVYVAGREAVTHVWVAGKPRIEDQKPVDPVESDLRSRLKMWQNAMR